MRQLHRLRLREGRRRSEQDPRNLEPSESRPPPLLLRPRGSPRTRQLLRSLVLLNKVVDDSVDVEVEENGTGTSVEHVQEFVALALPDSEVDPIVSGVLLPAPANNCASGGMA